MRHPCMAVTRAARPDRILSLRRAAYRSACRYAPLVGTQETVRRTRCRINRHRTYNIEGLPCKSRRAGRSVFPSSSPAVNGGADEYRLVAIAGAVAPALTSPAPDNNMYVGVPPGKAAHFISGVRRRTPDPHEVRRDLASASGFCPYRPGFRPRGGLLARRHRRRTLPRFRHRGRRELVRPCQPALLAQA